MTARIICLRNPFNPGQREVTTTKRRRKISNMAPRTTLPVIAYHNGRVILRREWHRKVRNGDTVAFVVMMQGGGGGGGKNPLQLVLSIAMMAISGPIANGIYGAVAEAGAGAWLSEFGFSVLKGAVSMVGNALISSAFAGKPSNPTPMAQASMAAPSPTYSMGAQGNMARLGQAIPVQYGRMMAFPDLAAHPYSEFAGNEQYVFHLFCLGQGYFDIEAIRIEDTPISSFPEIDYEVIEPGGTLTLFPANVVTSIEVAGQLAENGAWLGPFVASAAGTQANTIAIDVVCPRGMYYANDSGGLDAVSVSFTVEARPIDSSGAPLGAYVTLGSETISKATNTPQRFSYRYGGLSGRYEVRFKRTSAPGGSSRYADDLNWSGLRAYLPETRTWPGKTLIAMRMRASNSLSSQASRKVNLISTRKLPVWDGAAWTAPQVTRSPAWALADAMRADYAGNLPNARIDIDQLVTLAATCAARGDTFDGRFDSALTLWEALRKIGQAVRARPYIQGAIVHVVRDEAATVPVAMFGMRNIIRGSFGVEYLMPTEETADAITVSYFDEDTWSYKPVQAALPGSAAEKPFQVELFGVGQREQAHREGLYLAACNRYRRKRISFATESEGFIPSFGDPIIVSHDMPAWGTSGEVTGYVSATKTLALSEPVTFLTGTHYIGLRKRNGTVSGPYAVTAGADAYHVVHAGTLDFTPYTGGAEERTHFSFGPGENWRQPARVMAIKPRNLYQVDIECVNEDDSVHTADEGATAPAAQYSLLPNLFTAPVVSGLTVRSMLGDATVMLASWASAPGARYYVVDVSSDGDSWTRVGEPTANNIACPAIYGNSTIIRVAAYGFTLGPSIQVAYETVSDYMWSATDTTLMWAASDTIAMWSS